MSLYFWIFIGSGLGGVARFARSGPQVRPGARTQREPIVRMARGTGLATCERVRAIRRRCAGGANPLEGGAS